MLQVVHRVITRRLRGPAGLNADEADSGAVTPIQHFGGAASINIDMHGPLLDGVHLRGTEGAPASESGDSRTDSADSGGLAKV